MKHARRPIKTETFSTNLKYSYFPFTLYFYFSASQREILNFLLHCIYMRALILMSDSADKQCYKAENILKLTVIMESEYVLLEQCNYNTIYEWPEILIILTLVHLLKYIQYLRYCYFTSRLFSWHSVFTSPRRRWNILLFSHKFMFLNLIIKISILTV